MEKLLIGHLTLLGTTTPCPLAYPIQLAASEVLEILYVNWDSSLQLIRTKMKYSLQRMETASIKAFTFIELSLYGRHGTK